LELLHELMPKATVIAVLVNPNNPNTESDLADLPDAARSIGRRLHLLKAGSKREIDIAIGAAVEQQNGALLVGNDSFFLEQRTQLIEAAARHGLPAVYPFREFVEAGGLMSYSASSTEPLRQAGMYAARVLKGEKPADLPVQQASKFELVINAKTAKALGLALPPTLLARADEVIE
jgi:putative ABC transport system substrate-binding protein